MREPIGKHPESKFLRVPGNGADNLQRLGNIEQALQEGLNCDPAHQVAMKLDFWQWFATLDTRKKTAVLALANGDSTGLVARQLNVTASRVSQLRREFKEDWESFISH